MISRLSTFATVFAVTAAAAFAFTVHAQQQQQQPQAPLVAPAMHAKQVRIIELPRVVVVARRAERSAN